MKATDLMIGDLVVRYSHKNTPQQVIGIVDDCVTLKLGAGWCGEDIDLIEPIPITPDILEKNGFEKKEDDYGQELYSLLLGEWVITFMSIHGCPYLTIEDVLDYDRGHSVLNLKDSVYNVHELQHLLKLCGIDKEIKL